MIATDYIRTEERLGAHNYKPLDIVLSRGEGVWVYDVEDRRYLDGLAGYSALNQGHCHPRIVRAAVEQARRLTLTSRAFRNDQLPRLYEKLHEIAGYDKALMMNSGAEAVETALKAARKWGYTRKGIAPGQAEIIVCAGNFHGRTISIISFSTDAQYRDGFGPFTPGFRVVPFGDARALREAITPNTCAFLVEPIQGEAGIILPPPGYLREAADVCREANVLLIADEIQSGLGRAGRMFAHQHEHIRPDAVIVGKALAGGVYPVSAVLATRDVLGVFSPGDHGSTFGGNPLACAIACAALDVLVDERLAERSERLGTEVLERLRAACRHTSIVRDVRGRGLWIGIELDRPARPFCEALMREGLLCKETHDYVIRFAPPLVISRDELEWALERLERVLTRSTGQ
jgi:ornithine--oxo-acid transaminase